MNYCSDRARFPNAVKQHLVIDEKEMMKRKVISESERIQLSHASSWGIPKQNLEMTPMKIPKSTERGGKQIKSQPIHFKMKRSDSDIQLEEDLQAAEYRDYCMVLRMQGKHSSRKVGTTSRRPILQRMESNDRSPRYGMELNQIFESMSYMSLLHAFEESCTGEQPKNVDTSSGFPLPPNIFALIGRNDLNYDDEIFDLDF
jgi:hypothetical protein